jgi:hypothetical protein
MFTLNTRLGNTVMAAAICVSITVPLCSYAEATQPKKIERSFEQHRTSSGLWRIGDGFESTIQITNRLVTGPLDVSPILYSNDGEFYRLPEMHLAPASVATLDVAGALALLDKISLGDRSPRFGSAEIIFKGPPNSVLGAISIVNQRASLSYIAPFGPAMTGDSARQTLEGLWWRRDSHAGGFVAVSNATRETKTVMIDSVGSKGESLVSQSIDLPGHQTRMLRLLDLIAGTGAGEDAGGIRVSFDGRIGEINVVGGLENATGYSAMIPFRATGMSMGSASVVKLTHVGLMVGAPDAMMGFPEDTHFTPYLALRNTTPMQLSLSLALYLPAGTAVPVPIQPLCPYEARQVDGRALLASAGLGKFSGILTLSIGFTGMPTDLIDAAGTVDQSGSYVFEVDSKTAETSLSKSIPFWAVGNGQDTMLNLWNPTDTEEDLVLTLYFQTGGAPYQLPLHLAPWTSSMIDVGQVLGDMPNMSSARVQMGSMRIASPKGSTNPIALGVSVGIYDVMTATCYYGCVDCDGYVDVYLSPSAYDFFPTGTYSFTVYGEYDDGTDYDVSYGADWSSSNTSVATVDDSGDVTALRPGGASTITATVILPREGEICEYNPSCEEGPDTNFTGSAGINVYQPTYMTVSVGGRVAHNGNAVTTPDGDIVIPAPCYGYSRTYTYQIWSANGPVTQSSTFATESNTTTSANPSNRTLTPSETAGVLESYFYDVQAFCNNVPPGIPSGYYIKGTQQLNANIGPYIYPSLRVNTIDMEANDVTVTCTSNCQQ